MRGRWARIFAMLLPQAKAAARQCAVGFLATFAMLVWLMPRDDSIEIPLSIPVAAVDSSTWEEQRRAFGDRLERGYGLDEAVADEFAGWILEASTRQRLQPELIASLVMTESTFRKHARSPSGAVGPTQVKPDLWREFCGVDPLDPEQNIYCGAQILAHYRDACAGTRIRLKRRKPAPFGPTTSATTTTTTSGSTRRPNATSPRSTAT